MKNSMKLPICMGLFFCTVQLSAQTDLGQETIFTFGDRNLTLGDAFKINVSPSIIDSAVTIDEPNYLFTPKRAATKYEVKPILPARLRVMEPLQKLNRAYVRAGIGLRTTPLLQVSINQLRNKKSQVGLNFHHLSSDLAIDELAETQFSDNKLDVWGKFMFNKLTAETKVRYNRYVRHFYGYNPEFFDLTSRDIKQTANEIGGVVALANVFKDSSQVNFASDVDVNVFSDAFDASEIQVKSNNHFSKFHNKERYLLDVNVDINQLQSTIPVDSTEVKQSNGIVEITPQVVSKGKTLEVQAGLSIQGNMNKTAEFHFYPRVSASLKLFNNILIPYVGLKGGLIRNNLAGMFRENAFVSSHQNLINTNEKLVFYGGIRGSLSSSTSFNLSVSSKKVEDYLLYVNDTLNGIGNRFTAIYDDGRVLKVSGEINFQKGRYSEVYLKGDWFDYGFSTQNAWNLPDYQLTLGSRFRVAQKFKVGIELYYIGERQAKVIRPIEVVTPSNPTTEVEELDAFIDANLLLEYHYNKRISAFVQASNLANSGYQRWFRYETMPFTLIGGFSVKF